MNPFENKQNRAMPLASVTHKKRMAWLFALSPSQKLLMLLCAQVFLALVMWIMASLPALLSPDNTNKWPERAKMSTTSGQDGQASQPNQKSNANPSPTHKVIPMLDTPYRWFIEKR